MHTGKRPPQQNTDASAAVVPLLCTELRHPDRQVSRGHRNIDGTLRLDLEHCELIAYMFNDGFVMVKSFRGSRFMVHGLWFITNSP